MVLSKDIMYEESCSDIRSIIEEFLGDEHGIDEK